MSSARALFGVVFVAFAAHFGVAGAQVAEAQPPILPPGMIEACKGLTQGTPCQFQVGGKLIEGSCFPLPNSELACRPGSKRKHPKPKAAQPAG